MSRISRDLMFMEIAEIVAKRGTCDRARVGAVLVSELNNIVSIGYNGSPPGSEHCDDVGHTLSYGHCIRTIHAEENCIKRADLKSRQTYTLYVTHYPCIKCQAILFESCIKYNVYINVIYKEIYGEKTALESLKDVNRYINFYKFKVDEKENI